MPLRFARQLAMRPRSERARFGVTDVHRPVERQRHEIEHRFPQPAVSAADPERRMLQAVRLLPRPVVVRPQFAARIAAVVDEREELPVADLVLVDGERRHIDHVLFEFVVPAEFARIRTQAERRFAGRNPHGFRRDAARRIRTQRRRALLHLQRQLMQQIRQRLRVHVAMFDHDVEQFVDARVLRFAKCGVQFVAHLIAVAIEHLDRRPVARLIARQFAVDRIDAEREQVVQCLARIRQLEFRREQVPVERFQMSDVEHHPMPLGDRAFHDELGFHQREQRVGFRACVVQARQKLRSLARRVEHHSPSNGFRSSRTVGISSDTVG